MGNIIEEISYKGYNIVTSYDEDCASPREWDTLGNFYSNRRSYNPDNLTIMDLGETEEERHKNLKENYLFYPVSFYEHSGISIGAMQFGMLSDLNNWGWDSGLFGFYAVRKDNKEVQSMSVEEIKKVLLNEIKIFNDYLNGQCFGYEIQNWDGDVVDSCFGYIGEEAYQQMKEEAMDYCDEHPLDVLELVLSDFDIEPLKDLFFEFNEERKELLGLVKMLPVNENNQTIIEDLIGMLE